MEAKQQYPRSILGLLAALPFLIPQLIYLSDIHGWNVALSYGLFFAVYGGAFVLLLIYGAIEVRKRRKFTSAAYRAPWFSFAGFAFLISFFLVGEWVRPLVLQVPAWSRVNQVIRWQTSLPDEKYGGTHSFILVLVGRGNISQHEFVSGYLNWTGDGPAGFSNISPDDGTFSYAGGANYHAIPASVDVLQDRIKNSKIPEQEVFQISREIWTAFTQAKENKIVSVENGKVEPLWEAPFDQEDTVLGASIWMLFLLGSFQVISWQSIPLTNKKTEPVDGGATDTAAA